MTRKLMGLALVVIMLTSVFLFAGCNKKASCFTEEEHLERITERIKAEYIDGDQEIGPYDMPTDDGVIYLGLKATGFCLSSI